MYKLAITLSIMLFLPMFAGAQPAPTQTTEAVLIVPRGLEQTVAFQNVAGASVGNINIAHIEHLRPNEVVVSATGVGETFLEVTHRDGGTKRFLLHVVQASNTRSRTRLPFGGETAAISASLPEPILAGPAVQPTENSAESKSKSSAIVSTAATGGVQPGSKLNPDPPIEPPSSSIKRPVEQGSSILSRLEITTSTIVSYDSERIRMVNATAESIKDAAVRGEHLVATENDETITVRRSAVVTPVSFAFDLNSRNSLTLTVPYIRRHDEVVIGGTSFKTTGSGLGDIQLKFERRYPRLRKSGWEGLLGLNVGLPTGKSIYNTDSDQSPLGIGHYETSGSVGARRVFDPVTFNATLGLSYYFPRQVEGRTIAPGFGYSMQSGFGYALSDRWTLAQQLEFMRSPNVLLTTPIDAQTVSTDQAFLGHSLIYRPRGGHALQMMFNVGLTPGSSDFGLGLTYSYRRKNSKE